MIQFNKTLLNFISFQKKVGFKKRYSKVSDSNHKIYKNPFTKFASNFITIDNQLLVTDVL